MDSEHQTVQIDLRAHVLDTIARRTGRKETPPETVELPIEEEPSAQQSLESQVSDVIYLGYDPILSEPEKSKELLQNGDLSEELVLTEAEQIESAPTISNETVDEQLLNQYQRLLEAGSWKELVSLTQGNTSVSTSNSMQRIVRCYWVYGEIHRGEVPLPILAAPLEGLLEEYEADLKKSLDEESATSSAPVSESERELIQNVTNETISRLREEGEAVLACRLAEIILRLFPEDSEVRVAEKLAKESLSQKLDEIPHYKRSKEQQSTLSSLKEDAVSQKVNNYFAPKVEHNILQSTVEVLQSAKNAVHRHWIILCFFVVASMAMVPVIGGYFADSQLVAVKLSSSTFSNDMPILRESLIQPELTPLPLPSDLDMLLYNLRQNQNSALSPIQHQAKEMKLQVSDKLEQTPKASSQEDVTEVKQVALVTSEPAEPQYVREAIVRSRQKAAEESRPRVIDENYVLSGGLPEVTIATPENALNGRSAQVKNSISGQSFRIVGRTHVLSQPSFSASSMGELNSGAVVEVMAEKSEWLEIRSREGKVGFIPSQSAVPEKTQS